MLKLADKDIKILHIEPTDACNAACPQCFREVDPSFNKTNLHHLSIEQIKDLLDTDTIRGLSKIYMCGNYGDPAAGKHTLEIYKYFKQINPTITLGMNTNGGLRNKEWWQELAKIMYTSSPYPQEYVVFSIDGLEDTNHIYRVNVNWDKLIENVKAFISAGGQAHWDMLVFKHNEHQVEDAKKMAKNLGFKWFRAKISKRFDSIPVDFLQPPSRWENPNISSGSITCHALTEQSIYISAQGLVYPCCWLGTTNSQHTIDKFINIQKTWDTDPHIVCKNTCMRNDKGSSFTNQWQEEIEFNV